MPPVRPRVPVDLALSCSDDVAADEDLLRRGSTAARVAVLSDRAVSFGVGVGTGADPVARARSLGWRVVRRRSGGTGILHSPGDLAWTLVLPRGDARVGADYVRRYDRLGRAVVDFLAEVGIASAWTPSLGLSPSYCLLGGRGSVLTVEGRVLGGAAQHVAGGALLHHGILPWSLDRAALSDIFGLNAATGLGRLTCLSEIGIGEPAEGLAARLARSLENELDAA